MVTGSGRYFSKHHYFTFIFTAECLTRQEMQSYKYEYTIIVTTRPRSTKLTCGKNLTIKIFPQNEWTWLDDLWSF